MLNIPARHDILILSEKGRRQAEDRIEYLRSGYNEVWHKYNDVPAIFTGRYNKDGYMRIGFSFPVREDGNRIRMASYILPDYINQVITAWDIADTMITSNGIMMNLLRSVIARARELDIRIGVFGATAMQIVTEYEYLHEESDLDILIKANSLDGLGKFAKELLVLKEENGINIDAEVCVPILGYVKLGELMSEQSTVIVRGTFEPKLMKRCMILEGIDTI